MNRYLETIIYNWGIKASVVNKTYLECKKEASYLGQENNIPYIREMMYDILCEDKKLCTDRFIESKCESFQKFIEDLIDEEVIEIEEDVVSTGFATSVKPEVGPEAKPLTIGLDDEDENKKNQRQQDAV
jgi:hypothetical protein